MTRGAAESRRDAHAKLQLANQQAAGRRFKYLMQQSGLGDFFRDGFFETPVEEPSLRVEPLNVGDKRRKNSVDEKITDEPDTVEFLTAQPSVIQGQMRPYQLAGLNWMIRLRHNGLNGILADEMGLGKTLQSISMLGYLEEYSSVKGPHLVLVPKTTLSGWQNEFARWLPSLKVLKLHASTKDERAALVQEHFSGKRTWDVCLTTYEVATIEVNALKKVPWRFLIIDEVQISVLYLAVPRCCGAFTSCKRVVSRRGGRGWSLFRFWGRSDGIGPRRRIASRTSGRSSRRL